MPRKILIEFTVDWEDYDDVNVELIVEDAGIIDSLKEGVTYRILNDKPTTNDTE